MKKQLPAFLTGFLAAVLVLSLSLSAFAAITGKTTIEVGPISIKVKGEIFQPTDVNGNPVDVFVYNGTTYAPLRALAEAYGLEVSYDGEAKMAVVEEPEEAVEPSAQPVVPGDYSDWSEELEAKYQTFKGLWRLETTESGTIFAHYIGKMSHVAFFDMVRENETLYREFYKRFSIEKQRERPTEGQVVSFFVGDVYTASVVVPAPSSMLPGEKTEFRNFYIP